MIEISIAYCQFYNFDEMSKVLIRHNMVDLILSISTNISIMIFFQKTTGIFYKNIFDNLIHDLHAVCLKLKNKPNTKQSPLM